MQYLVVVWNALPYIAGGVFVTAGIVLAALALGFVLGVPLALAQAYGGSALRRAVAYRVGFFRGTPVLVLLFLFYFGLLVSLDLDINAFFSSCIVLGLTNEFSILLKDSAICFVLGTQAIMARTHFAASRTHEHLALFALAGLLYFLLTLAGLTFRVTEVFFGVGLYYLVLVTLTGRLLYILERRLHIPGLGTVPRNILQWRTPKKIEYFFGACFTGGFYRRTPCPSV